MLQFETDRLLMRPLLAEDQEFYCACYTNEKLMRHIGAPLTEEAAMLSFNAALKIASAIPVRRHTWAMEEKVSGNAIGLLALFCDQAMPEPISAELGIIMLTRFQNKGYPNEAMGGLVDFAYRNTRLEVLLGKHKTHNGAASRIMRRLDFTLVTDITDVTMSKWTLSRNDWQVRSVANVPD